VQAGDTLWRILERAGLARGASSATLARIVADNPHAFVNGNADRLKLGALLTLPANGDLPQVGTARSDTTGMASPAVAVVVTTSAVAPTTTTLDTSASKAPVDDETRARLDALTQKFTAIRARYAAQSSAAGTTAVVPPHGAATASRPAIAESMPESATAVTPSAVTDSVRAPALESTTTDAPEPLRALHVPLLVATATLTAGLVLFALWRRPRPEQPHGSVPTARAGDAYLREQIAAKAEKRIQLEDEFKRTRQRRDEVDGGNATPRRASLELVAGTETDKFMTTLERLADLENSAGGLEEIETRIAYGQHREAELLLLEVLKKWPANHRAKLRLAEIYYLGERHDAFVKLASEIHRLHRSDIDDDDWQRIMRMGKLIAPTLPPFSGPLAVDAAREAS
jgi:hypothetical protein